jgi:hypothetical protein
MQIRGILVKKKSQISGLFVCVRDSDKQGIILKSASYWAVLKSQLPSSHQYTDSTELT